MSEATHTTVSIALAALLFIGCSADDDATQSSKDDSTADTPVSLDLSSESTWKVSSFEYDDCRVTNIPEDANWRNCVCLVNKRLCRNTIPTG